MLSYVPIVTPDPTNPHPILTLIASSTAQNELEDARAWYEAFLKVYPTAVRVISLLASLRRVAGDRTNPGSVYHGYALHQAPQFLSYVELELAHDNQAQVEALFSRAFAKSAATGPVFPLAYPPLWSEDQISMLCSRSFHPLTVPIVIRVSFVDP